MPGKAAKIVITERQQLLLQEMASSLCIQVRLAERAAIILLAFEGVQNQEIGIGGTSSRRARAVRSFPPRRRAGTSTAGSAT